MRPPGGLGRSLRPLLRVRAVGLPKASPATVHRLRPSSYSCKPMAALVSPGITKLVGRTPLLRVRVFEREFPRVEVYAKAEWFNPGGSVKDRAALSMIEDGERRGALTRDKAIIDSTSGNH